jgi:alkyl hydroperoxide reductase subunit AhpC
MRMRVQNDWKWMRGVRTMTLIAALSLSLPVQDHLEDTGMPFTVRSVFIIGPDRKIKTMFAYPASAGRNFDEILRVLDALQLTVTHKVATPADWTKGKDCVVLPTISTEDAKTIFPKGVKEIRPWLRTTPDPSA